MYTWSTYLLSRLVVSEDVFGEIPFHSIGDPSLLESELVRSEVEIVADEALSFVTSDKDLVLASICHNYLQKKA